MKIGSKKGWKSGMPLCLKEKSVTHFCFFPQIFTAGQTSGTTPVYLNVYDLSPVNGYIYWAGFGIFHSGVEVHGMEYAFGAHDYSTSGVFEVEPRECPGFKFKKSVLMGTTSLDPIQVREFMELHSASYNGDTYHLLFKNCNHFCNDICHKLTGNKIPKWVNRLAKLGSACSFLLPDALVVSAAPQESDPQRHDVEKRRLRSAFSSLPSISMRQRQLSECSILIQSPWRGCLPPGEPRKSRKSSSKQR